MKLSLGLSLALLGALSSAHAAPVKYNIQFTTTFGSPTPSGSFFYDPDVPVFSGFLVVWSGFSFNMTAAANAPSLAIGACNTAGNGAADTFDFLLNQNCGSGQYLNGWSAYSTFGGSGFSFLRSNDLISPANAISVVVNVTDMIVGFPSADGTFSISLAEAPVPEPATLSLLTAAAALLAVRLRIRRPS